MTTLDHDLLSLGRAGDKSAGQELFRRYVTLLRRFFSNKVSPTEVDDLVQKTFVTAVEGRERLRGNASFRTTLFAVARHQLDEFLRHRNRQNVTADLTVSSVSSFGMTPAPAETAPGSDQDLVLTALQRVSVEYQTMLELYYWEGLPGAEIAVVFEIAPATVRTRLQRARQALEDALRRIVGEDRAVDVDRAALSLRSL